jgi:hypothetical protein
MIIPIAILYVLVFWLIVSSWLFFDAKKRYQSWKKALLILILNIIFGIPFLIFYLLVRPFDGEEELIIHEKSSGSESKGNNGGVNVPVVNFIGKDGMVMSLQLSINPNTAMTDSQPEMKINVNFESSDPQKQLVAQEIDGIKVVDISGVAIGFSIYHGKWRAVKSPATRI